MQDTTCPICLNRDGYSCQSGAFGSYDATIFNCDVCGEFVVSRTALVDSLERNLTSVARATLSHHVRLQTGTEQARSMWTTDRLEAFFANEPRLPTPAQQATNIIALIGGAITLSGMSIDTLPPSLPAIVGSPNAAFAQGLIVELKNRGLINAITMATYGGHHSQDVSLTLSGWELFERERQGKISGNHGFVALKFGDPVLDPLLRDHIKPSVREIGYDLLDLRDVARAGVIDNLLRMQIRDAAFVLVDLTHENAGAYWEAGYAEGLGKPVLYLCERAKFEETKTHFDTNHCTTVLWDADEPKNFTAELQATIRRSLLP